MRKLLLAVVLMAVVIAALACAEATPTPTPRPTATPVPTATPTATATPVPGVPTATPTPTPRPVPTATATPAPTAVPKGRLGPGPAVTFQFMGFPTATLIQQKDFIVPWATQIIPERSGGRVKPTVFNFSDLGINGPEILRLVKQGIMEVSNGTFTFVAGDAPILEGVDLAGLYPTVDLAKRAGIAWKEVAADATKALGVGPAFIGANPVQVLFCKPAVRSLADLKGLKVRGAGSAIGDFSAAVGAQGVTVAFQEVYSALERGVVDCAVTGTGSGYAQKWYEVTKYLYTLPLTWAIDGTWINLAWYNGLAPDVRTFLDAIFAEMQDAQWKLANDLTQDGINCNVNRDPCTLGTKGKMIEATPSDADKALLRSLLESEILPRWLKRCGKPECAATFNRVIAPIAGVTAKG